jgi:YhcH/YjgK/YiaL family protein
VFALVQRYVTKPPAEGRWEAHRRYIDLQFVAAGQERIGYTHISRLTADPYDPERDLTWLSGPGDLVTVPGGSFMLLWPQDAHMPGISVDRPEPVTKMVIKIAVG